MLNLVGRPVGIAALGLITAFLISVTVFPAPAQGRVCVKLWLSWSRTTNA